MLFRVSSNTRDSPTGGPRIDLNLNVRGMAHSATVAIHARTGELLRQGRRIFKLGFGQSPFPVPESVVQALRDHAHEKDYLPVHGLRELRDTVAAYHAGRERLERSGDDVLIGPGSKELMFLLQLVYHGDLVIPTPAWVSYAPQARIIGRQVHSLPTAKDQGWSLRPETLDALCRSDPDRPRVLILNYPSNPTGGTLDEDQLRALAEVARAYGVVLLSDEIYGELHHRGEHISIARFYPEGTIISSGLSKWCGAGGWRLGTFVFPPGMRWLLEAMAATASETYTSTSAPIQYAAVRAFQGGSEIDAYVSCSRRVLSGLGAHIHAALRAGGVDCPRPDGAFYLFPDFGPVRDRLASRGIGTSAELCEALLRDTGVAMLPGSEFGRPQKELTCRLAYVDFEGGAALAAVARAPGDAAPEAAFLRAHCGRVCEAIDRLLDWLHHG
jgi:aspartate aminotransferase